VIIKYGVEENEDVTFAHCRAAVIDVPPVKLYVLITVVFTYFSRSSFQAWMCGYGNHV